MKQLRLIAGPCAIEGRDMAFRIAEEVQRIAEKYEVDFIFKGSYRKANRSRLDSFTGIGDEKALSILQEIGSHFNLRTTTDIHESGEADMAAAYVDILQIPAFLCRQTDLLVAAARTDKIVNIKKGQFMSAESMKYAVEKVKAASEQEVWLTERGTTFGYQDLVVDFRAIPVMQQFADRVIMDCTHSLQQPNQSEGVTGGRPAMIQTIAKAAAAVGVDGFFIETHFAPDQAQSDGANMLPLSKLEALLQMIKRIHEAIASSEND